MKQPKKPEALAARTASRLRERIQISQWEVLPSYSDLARQLGVSRITVAQAVRLLAIEGWVAPKARSRTMVLRTRPAAGEKGQSETLTEVAAAALSGTSAAPPFPSSPAAGSLYRRLREDILSGNLPIGEVLPKIGHMSGIHRCSHGTVLAALRRLLRDSLLHREGRRYVTPNDNWARNLVNWLRQAHPPARSLLPLVSFDHAFRFSSSGISTVDFGYGGLGYRTFHALTGILPVRPDKKAEYISAPLLVEREETLVIDLPLPAP